jgi:hypothetical protein
MHTKFKSENENAFMASMKVNYQTSGEGEAHTIKEKLVKPHAINLAACSINEEAARETHLLPLSDNMIQRRIPRLHSKCTE